MGAAKGRLICRVHLIRPTLNRWQTQIDKKPLLEKRFLAGGRMQKRRRASVAERGRQGFRLFIFWKGREVRGSKMRGSKEGGSFIAHGGKSLPNSAYLAGFRCAMYRKIHAKHFGQGPWAVRGRGRPGRNPKGSGGEFDGGVHASH